MSDKSLALFELCDSLCALLGEREAIADLRLIRERHPEMFNSIDELERVISEVVREPDIITRANRQGAFLAVKQLDESKMGEIAIENDNGTNVIFHANKKRLKEMHKLIQKLKETQPLVETPTPSTHRSKSAGELTTEKLSSGANALSTATNGIIPQNSKNEAMERKMSADGRDFTPPTYRQSGGEARLEQGSNPEPSSSCSSTNTNRSITKDSANVANNPKNKPKKTQTKSNDFDKSM